MIAIIDYGAGNIFSVKNALDYLGFENKLTDKKEDIEKADAIILPGVGAFPWAMNMLGLSGLIDTIKEQAKIKPFLGICLGMQLLFEKSYEFEECKGLGLIGGYVDKINEPDLVIPHMGWNSLHLQNDGRLFKGIPEETYVYFVHSYYLQAKEPEIVKATAQYGVTIHASVEKDNIFACQFHPEKSSKYGLKILENFAKLGKEA